MSSEEKSVWISGSSAVMAYADLPDHRHPAARRDAARRRPYVAPFLLSIGGAIVALDRPAHLLRRRPEKKDQRDREIYRFGETVGQAFVVIGGVGAMLLALFEFEYFWIANVDLPLLRALRHPELDRQARRLPLRDAAVVKPTQVTNSIRALRFAHGEMTQADLADRVGVTRQTVIAIEQGKYSPSLEMAFQIARVFGVPLDDVFQYPEDDVLDEGEAS